MSDTPIGDAVANEYPELEGIYGDGTLPVEVDYVDPASQDCGDAEPPADEDPAPVLNDDADDDLADVPEGEDDGDSDLDGDPDDGA